MAWRKILRLTYDFLVRNMLKFDKNEGGFRGARISKIGPPIVTGPPLNVFVASNLSRSSELSGAH